MLLNKETQLTQDSYYEASVIRADALAPLQGLTSADVCVVGAGLAGLSAALELAQRGYSVTVLEAKQVGWGASGRNGGQAIVGYASDDAIEAQFSNADARCAWNLTVEGLQLLRDRIKTHAINCDYQAGYLSLAVNARKAKALAQWAHHVQQTYDYPLKSIQPADMPNWIDSTRFHSGVYDVDSGHLHPLKYCLGLAEAARKAGVVIDRKSVV